ncbi:MAG: ABC transporter permease [Eubacteriales bacterium]|nr:ABC transporter permease [Eubacteriales bacterium]MDD4475240.1 ABC transporter permease [Eubacteriales bacterium]
MGAIYTRELKSYFTTPIGYIFLAVFFAVTGFCFSYTTILQAESSSVSAYFLFMIFILAIMLPILTMKLFSDDRRSKTEQLLLTSPVGLPGMVMAKYLAALTIYACALGVSSVYFFILGSFGTPPTAIIIGNIIALLFLGAAFIAIGSFMSSLTESQLIAAISSMLVILLIVITSVVSNSIPNTFIRTILNWFSVINRMSTFAAGQINLGSLIYFASFTFMFLFLTVRVYEKRRWS